MKAKQCSLAGCGIGGETPRAPGRSKRIRRLLAGCGFIAVAAACVFASAWLWPVSVIVAWFGISHVVAAATAYGGCPELGAIASLIVGRPVKTGCRPWQRIDDKMNQGASHE